MRGFIPVYTVYYSERMRRIYLSRKIPLSIEICQPVASKWNVDGSTIDNFAATITKCVSIWQNFFTGISL